MRSLDDVGIRIDEVEGAVTVVRIGTPKGTLELIGNVTMAGDMQLIDWSTASSTTTCGRPSSGSAT